MEVPLDPGNTVIRFERLTICICLCEPVCLSRETQSERSEKTSHDVQSADDSSNDEIRLTKLTDGLKRLQGIGFERSSVPMVKIADAGDISMPERWLDVTAAQTGHDSP